MSTSSEIVYSNIKQLLDTIELEESESLNQELQEKFIVKDDLGEWWYFTGDRIRCLGDSVEEEETGYDCASFADGVEVLKKNGYIDHG